MADHLRKYRTYLIALILALIVAPTPARAQEPPIPQPPPDLAWEAIPDIIGGISIAVPQCPSALNPQPPPDPDWWNVGSVLAWLGGWIGAYTQLAICWLLYALQILVNALVGLVNTIIDGINDLWRTFVYLWLQFRGWLTRGVYWIVEVVRSWWMTVEQQWWTTLRWLLDQAQLALAQLLDLLWSVWQVVSGAGALILNALGWIAGLILPPVLLILVSLGWLPGAPAATPAPLNVSERYYCAVHGTLRGVAEAPQTSWVYWLAVAMAYIAFVIWIARFLSSASARQGGET